jgi:hypothetical protein
MTMLRHVGVGVHTVGRAAAAAAAAALSNFMPAQTLITLNNVSRRMMHLALFPYERLPGHFHILYL